MEADGKGNQAGEGGTAESGVCGVGERAVIGVYLGFEVVDEEFCVEGALAAAELGVAVGGVLGHAAGSGVGDADEDDGFYQACGGEAVGGGVDLPGMAGEVGEARVDEVLAVVKIEDGEAAMGFGEVGFWQIDVEGAVVGQEAGVEVR